MKRACLADVPGVCLAACPAAGVIGLAAPRVAYAVVFAIALGACGMQEGRLVPAAEVLAKAKATSDHPLGGFWGRADCSQDFGLAIGPMSEGTYFVSFCSQIDCFAEGTYRPDTSIYGDASYRVIDEDTIEVLGKSGFNRYVRCPPLVPKRRPDA